MKLVPISRFAPIAALVLAEVSGSGVFAGVIEDFETFPVGEIAPQDWPYALEPAADAPRLFIYEDPADASNQALFIDSSEVDLIWGDSFVSIPIPESEQISIGQSGTISFRAYVTGYSNNWYLITSDLDKAAAWGDGCTLIEVHENLPGVVKARDSNTYRASSPNYVMALDTWYQFRVDIDNSAKTYQVSVQGPSDLEPVLLTFGSTDSPAFRRNSQGAIQTISIATYNGAPGSENDGDLWLIDDIAVGEEESICGFELVDGVHLNTGDWLGWLYAEHDPWMYSWVISSWLYIPACPDEGGAWVYLAK